MDAATLEKYKKRFSKEDFDIAKIIECSANLAPLVAFQKRVKEQNKKRQQERIQAKLERKKKGFA